MPLLNLKLSVPPSTELAQAAAALLSEHSQRLLGKDPALTAVVVEFINPAHWVVGGQPLSAQQRHSFWLDIKITDETNTKAEKARFISAVFEAFALLLGELHEESYIHVHDARAAAYGYGGRTQEARYHQPV